MRRAELPKLISDTVRLMRTLVDQRGRGLGLTRAQAVVLYRLAQEDGQRQVDLAEYLEVEPISAARLVDKLEESGYVARKPDAQDRRVKRVYLTREGRAAQAAFKKVLDALFEEVFAGMSDSRVEAMARDLEEAKARVAEQLSRQPRRD